MTLYVTAVRLQRLSRSGRIRALRRGVYVETRRYDEMSSADRAKASAVSACLTWPGSVISHASAALIRGLPMLDARPGLPTLTLPIGSTHHGTSDPSTRLRVAGLPPWQVQQRGSLSLTTAARTVCDLAREVPLMHALVLADGVLFRRLATLDELCAVRDSCPAWPRISRVRQVLRMADDRSESPYETVARFQLLEAGFTAVPQVWAYDALGPIGCGDLWLPDSWVFLEVDAAG